MAIDYSVFTDVGGQPKPEPRKRSKARKDRKEGDRRSAIHDYVFEREQHVCRCCRLRVAESMHELKSRGAGGKVSKTNSIAVCGTIVGAVPSCHTYLQDKSISYTVGLYGAEDVITFCPRSDQANEKEKREAHKETQRVGRQAYGDWRANDVDWDAGRVARAQARRMGTSD